MFKNKSFLKIKKPKKDRGFLYPNYKPSIRRLLILIGGLYLRIFEGVSKIDTFAQNRTTEALKNFYSGRERLIFVFKHAAKEDPSVLYCFFLKKLRKIIKKEGFKSYVTFLYGRDVPNWAGKITEWLFPRIGAIPVQTYGANKKALSILRNEISNGNFPLALAPEGQVVYHMYKSFNIAPGVSLLVKWGLENKKPVRVVPLAIAYQYSKTPEIFIRQKLAEWEKQSGIHLKNISTENIYTLLCMATQETLALLEPLCEIEPQKFGNLQTPAELDNRVKNLCAALLDKAEKEAEIYYDGAYNSKITERLFAVRYRGYDAFFQKEDPAYLPPLLSAFVDFKAIKAAIYIRYERIVDVLEYVHLSYIEPPFSSGRGCEFVLNLLDVINRAKGGSINTHVSPKRKRAAILSGEPLLYMPHDLDNHSRKEFLNKIKNDVSLALENTSTLLEEKWETKKIK